MPERRNVSSGAPWEETVGYSRAVRIGDLIAVSGTVSRGPFGRLGSSEEAYRQALQALRTIQEALEAAGARLEDVIRTRIYVTDIVRDSEAVGRAHREFFGAIRPAATMVEVARLIDKKMLVEIEADAVAPRGPEERA
ncbi:MAG: RidA family protein [Acidobacteria bacterium]|nr:RidA family protein [Acidobacteriota bacterium]